MRPHRNAILAKFMSFVLRAGILTLASAALLGGLAGCGGSGGGTSGGGTVNPPPNATPLVGTAKFSVNVETGKVQVTPLSGDPTSRAIFSGTALTFQANDLITDPGELTRRKIAVQIRNNTGEAVGAPGSGFKVMFGDFTDASGTDLRALTNVSTFIGSGASGSADGPNLSATLSSPHSVAWDSSQDAMYFSGYNQSLRVSKNGTVTTVITGIGPVVSMVWKNGNPNTGILWAASLNTHRIYMLDVNAKKATLIGGTGSVGGDDGPGSTARFNLPYAIAEVPNSGSADWPNLLVSEGTTGKLRLMQHDGTQYQVSTLPFTNDAPRGMISIGDGRFAVSEAFLRRITIFDLSGNKVSLGSGSDGQANGDGTTMQFYEPIGLWKDGNTIYVSESGGVIRQLTLDDGAMVTRRESWKSATIAGVFQAYNFADGRGDEARFLGPVCMTTDNIGHIYVADSGNQRIRKISPTNGRFPFVLNSGANTGVDKVRLANPTDFVPTDSGSKPYIQENQRITPNEAVSLTPWSLIIPQGVKNFEFIVTVEANTDTIAPPDAVFNAGPDPAPGSARAMVRTLTGATTPGYANGNVSAAAFGGPVAFAYDAQGNLFVADSNNRAVRRVSLDGKVTTVAGLPGNDGAADGTGSTASFGTLTGITVNSAGDVLYVADSTNNTVRRITLTGGEDPAQPFNWKVSTIAGVAGPADYANGDGAAARFNRPWGIVLTSGGELVLSEAVGNRIRRLVPAGQNLDLPASWSVSSLAGSTSGVSPIGSSVDGIGANATFNNPRGLALAPTGEVIVADRVNCRIRSISSTGVVKTIAGRNLGYGDSDTGLDAKFTRPSAVAVDSAGYIYVTDTENFLIRRVSPAGAVRTIAGAGSNGTNDGPGNVAKFSNLNAIAINAAGDVIVGDGPRIRLIQRLITNGG